MGVTGAYWRTWKSSKLLLIVSLKSRLLKRGGERTVSRGHRKPDFSETKIIYELHSSLITWRISTVLIVKNSEIGRSGACGFQYCFFVVAKFLSIAKMNLQLNWALKIFRYFKRGVAYVNCLGPFYLTSCLNISRWEQISRNSCAGCWGFLSLCIGSLN